MNTTKTKRLAAFLISLVMMLSLIPTQVWAAPTSERYGLSALSTMENSENLVWAYNTLDSAVAAGQETVPFTDETHAVSSNELDLVWEVYCYDHPEFFWLSAYDYEFGKGKVKNVFLTYALAGDELTAARTAFNAATEEALSGITADMDDLAKEIYLHDYLANKVTYVAAANAHNAYGALVEGQAVCEGYSRAFQHLLLQVGIPCYVVLGTGKGQPHMWNLVKINGEYYHVDLTWDDGNNGTYYAYFNVTTEQILENHTITEPIHGIPTPPCTATAANYFEVYGGKMASGDVDTICAMLDNPDLFARIYITGDPDAFLTWLQSNLEAIIDNANVSGNVSCSYNYSGREFQIHLYGDYAHTHNMTHVDALAATCQSEGNVEYWVCSKCDLQFADAAGTTELTNVKTEIDPTNHVGGTEIRDSIDASCERDGYTGDTYCLGCGIKLSSGTNTPKTHTTVHVDAIPATCKDTGTAEHWNCTSCGRNFADEDAATELTNLTTPKDPNNHVGGTTIKNEAPATCTIPGNTGDTYCLGCDSKLFSGKIIPASHVMSHVDAVPATCKDTGTVEHWHCAVCSKDFADAKGKTELTTLITPKDPTNHVGGIHMENASDPNCTVPGNTGDTYCNSCNTKLKDGQAIPAGHTTTHVAAIPATCKDTGTVEHWHCSVCNKNFADSKGKTELTTLITPKDATNHVGGTIIKNKADATCTIPGNTGDTYCKGCDTKLVSGNVIPAGHVMNRVNAVPATCKDTGTAAHWHCSVCDKNFADSNGKNELTNLTLAIDPKNHVGETELRGNTAPTCKENGYTGDTYCLSCNEKIGTGTVIKTTHVLKLVPAKTPTCKEPGNKAYWLCSCGKIYDNDAEKTLLVSIDDCKLPVDPDNHVGFQTKWSMNADSHWHACTSCTDGKSALAAHDYTNACDTTCNTCGYTREITHTPADNYSYDDNGHWKVCSVCGKTVEAIEGHKGGTATCIAKAICSVCNQPYGNLGSHNAENWRQTKAPTFTATGEKTGHCTVCDKDVITIVPMLTMPMDGKDSGSTKMSKSELTSVPAALTGVEKMDTLDEIRDALRKAIKDQKSSVSDSNIKFYDVSIMVAGPNGEYVPMTADNLPKNGEVTILMSYPEGTNKQNYAFYASHAITDARYGEVGSVEAPTVKATDAGLEITIHGASPVALGWYKTSRSNYSGATTVNQTKNSAATGDVGILAYILCGTGSLGLGAVLVNNKRRRH